jgi:hypothetical protein
LCDTPGRFRDVRVCGADDWLLPVMVCLPCGAGMGSRVELLAAIRWDHRREGSSVRALARKYNVRRRTVREAVAGWIDAILAGDLGAPRKQRHTARRVFERLRDEHGARVSYSYVCKQMRRPWLGGLASAVSPVSVEWPMSGPAGSG